MPTPSKQVLVVEDQGDVTLVKFVDPMIMDEQIIKAIGDQLFSLVEELGRRNLRLDFTGVEYLASHILGKLVSLQKKTLAAGGKLTFFNVDPQIHKVFEISRLDKFFKIEPAEPGKPAAS